MSDTRSTVFGSLRIAWDERLLEPRVWTAMQSEWASELAAAAPDGALLELCTGAGHIGLLAAELSGRRLVAVDLDPTACSFARANAAAAGLGDRVEVRQGALESVVADDEVFALAIADPPWVTSAGVAMFPADPLLAIDGGADGLSVARACLDACLGHLGSGGSVLVQLGDQRQAGRLVDEARGTGWTAGGLRQGDGGVVQQLLHP